MTARRRAVLEVGGTVAVAVATAWAIYAEWGFIHPGMHILGSDTKATWAVAAVGMECLSMVAFSLLQGCLLRASGARLTLGWLMSTAYTANAIAVSVPVVGSGMAAAYDYRQLQGQQVDPAAAKATLTIAGVISTASLGVVVAIAAIVSGNPAGGVGGAIGGAAAVAAVLAAPHFSGSARLERFLTRAVGRVRKMVRRPRRAPADVARSVMELLESMRLHLTTLARALVWGALNWLFDAACLVLALEAVGIPVPWRSVLLIWSAGVSAGSFSPTPDGIGVVEVTMTAGLVAAGIHAPDAVAAVLLYRLVAFKVVITTFWFVQRALARHRRQRRLAT